MGHAPTPADAAPKGKIELADIFRAHGPRYRRTHRLALAQRRVMRAIETCRTAALGGHTDVCDSCGAVRIAYNSCRNRHCPKCQTLAKQRWLEARRAELLPVGYFHVVVTLPHELNGLAQGNPRLIYNFLFNATAETLATFAADPKRLGGELGITAILHTWGQTLSQHLHLHCVVTGGALARDGSRWIPAKARFLFPVKALSKMVRGKYLARLRGAFEAGELVFSGQTAPLADAAIFADWLHHLKHRPWVVYAKRPFAGPQQVLEYLGRYTHRVAISNERLLGLERGSVRFRWKDRAHGDTIKVMELDAEEFIRRFQLHVVPDGFVRIRHFGILANRSRKAKLDRCRRLLGQPPARAETATESVRDLMLRLTGIEIDRCSICHRGRMRVREILPPAGSFHLRIRFWDTS